MSGIDILLDSANGIYIPKLFVTRFDLLNEDPATKGEWFGVSEELVTICADRDHEWYWPAWYTILGNAYFIDGLGNKWTLHQDGDLFAVCETLATSEELENLFGEY